MMFTDDPVTDFLRYDAIRSHEPEWLGVCEFCGEDVFDDESYRTKGKGVAHSACIDRLLDSLYDYK